MIYKLNCIINFLKSNVNDIYTFLTLKSLFFSLVSAEDFEKPFIVPDSAYVKHMIPDAGEPGNSGDLADLKIQLKSLLPTHILPIKHSSDFGT